MRARIKRFFLDFQLNIRTFARDYKIMYIDFNDYVTYSSTI